VEWFWWDLSAGSEGRHVTVISVFIADDSSSFHRKLSLGKQRGKSSKSILTSSHHSPNLDGKPTKKKTLDSVIAVPE